jgi:branched-chain amino acid transport system ATP-binding protein
MMLDEPSLGLSPRLSEEVFACIRSLSREMGITILLVEQNTQRALELADRAYVIELGRVVSQGKPETLLAGGTLLEAYLGGGKAKPVRAEQAQAV